MLPDLAICVHLIHLNHLKTEVHFHKFSLFVSHKKNALVVMMLLFDMSQKLQIRILDSSQRFVRMIVNNDARGLEKPFKPIANVIYHYKPCKAPSVIAEAPGYSNAPTRTCSGDFQIGSSRVAFAHGHCFIYQAMTCWIVFVPSPNASLPIYLLPPPHLTLAKPKSGFINPKLPPLNAS